MPKTLTMLTPVMNFPYGLLNSCCVSLTKRFA
nr:MAG TPA: hypothetical protein [Caudoviricetes sp.]